VRAALASWGRGSTVVGGVALIGCQPDGCDGPVDAVVVLPRGVLVVLGVDLPDPAVRLDAPLAGQWKNARSSRMSSMIRRPEPVRKLSGIC